MLGVDLATIQSIVGHADVDMTKHYLHVQEPVKLAAIEKFSSAFSGEKGPDLDVLEELHSALPSISRKNLKFVGSM